MAQDKKQVEQITDMEEDFDKWFTVQKGGAD